MTLQPVGERVILTPHKQEEKTASGILIPDDAKEKKKQGTIVSVGVDTNQQPLPLSAGDTVLYGGYSNEEIEIDGEEYVIVDYKDILAVLR